MTNGFFSGSTIKEERMISFRRLPILLGTVMMMASAAFAQTTGTITVTGSQPEAFSLTDGSGAALTSTIALGALIPGNTTTLSTGTATVNMRSNKAYKVTAQASPLNIPTPGATDGGDDIALTDIGFAVTAMTLTGTNVANSGSRAENAGGFALGTGWPTATNGLTPAFGKTLNDIQTPQQILQGTRISKKGNLSTNDNFISVTFGVATLPQFFTPNTGFSTVITLTMASQ
jgi:hypothetical protein